MNGPVRVLHIIGKMNRDGAETFIMNIYRNVDRTKVQFDFLVHTELKCDYDDEILSLGGNIHRVCPKGENAKRNIIDTYKVIRDNDYNIVHIHSALSTTAVDLFIAKLAGAKIRIYHSHSSNNTRRIMRIIHRSMIPFTNLFATHKLACARIAAQWMYGMFGAKGAIVINNSIDARLFTYDQSCSKSVRQKLGLVNKFVIGHVGRFAEVKNHEFLIDIFKIIHDQIEDSVLLLIGKGELLEKIMMKVEAQGLTNCVMFLGTRDDVSELMQAMDVFVLPSVYEGLPLVLIEAQAAGLPVVASDCITSETDISGLIRYESLSKAAGDWADTIISAQNSKREDTYSKIARAGYDISDNTLLLSELYLTGRTVAYSED